MVERFPWNKPQQTLSVSSRPTGVLAGSVTIRWGGLSRDPVFWKQPTSPETNHLQTTLPCHHGLDPWSSIFKAVWSPSRLWDWGNLYIFPCRLELQTTSQHGVQRAFTGCKYPPDAWALWTSCVRKNQNPGLLHRIQRGLHAV